MLSKSEKILMSLNSKHKPLCQLATTEHTLTIRYIKSDKLRQTNCNGISDNFVLKKAGQNRFNCLLCYVQPYLI